MSASGFAVAAALLIVPTLCQAQEIPTYGDAYCKALTTMMGGNKLISDGCAKGEQDYRVKLDRVWGDIDPKERQQCISMAAMNAGGSYQGLAGCVVLTLTSKILNGELKVVKP